MAYPNPILCYLPLNGTLQLRDRLSPNLSTATGSGALRWAPAEGARVNYCLNSRLAVGTSNWIGSTAALSRAVDPLFVGGTALETTISSAGTGRGCRTNGTEALWRAGNGVRTFSFDAYLVTGDGALNPYAVEMDAAGNVLSSVSIGSCTLSSQPSRYVFTYTPSQSLQELRGRVS